MNFTIFLCVILKLFLLVSCIFRTKFCWRHCITVSLTVNKCRLPSRRRCRRVELRRCRRQNRDLQTACMQQRWKRTRQWPCCFPFQWWPPTLNLYDTSTISDDQHDHKQHMSIRCVFLLQSHQRVEQSARKKSSVKWVINQYWFNRIVRTLRM